MITKIKENEITCRFKIIDSLVVREEHEDRKQSYRTEFMRDSDRILYSKSFRRLAGKTQVYLSGIDDHIRTRLTHTLEVSQIARTISHALKLDEHLTEAIALGHDLGHAPFGHVGERTLHEMMVPRTNHDLGKECPFYAKNKATQKFKTLKYKSELGFKHNLQGLINVTMMEKHYDKNGLNLTNFTLYGIQNHSSPIYGKKIIQHDQLGYYKTFLEKCTVNGKPALSLEAFVVEQADEIAQRHHDLEDAIRGNLIKKEDIFKNINGNLTKYFNDDEMKDYNKLEDCEDIEKFITIISGLIVNLYVTELVEQSTINLNEFILNDLRDLTFSEFIQTNKFETIKNIIGYSEEFVEVTKGFKKFTFEKVLLSHDIQKSDAKGKYIIKKLFQAYFTNPQQLPDHCLLEYMEQININNKVVNDLKDIRKIITEKRSEKENILLMRVICNHIAGMTDAYAIKMYHELY